MHWIKGNVGDTRIVTRFLVFPKTINNEIRWLEKARIKQEFRKVYDDGIYEFFDWVNVAFVDKK